MPDLDDAYSNGAYIEGAESFPVRWAEEADAFRQKTALKELNLAYGETARQRYDLFHPDRLARGLFVFVHGGYWMDFDKNSWSHLARGVLAHGWAVAMPSYTLAPDAQISEITSEIECAIGVAASKVPGPIRLAGHSAGGHLVGRMACVDRDPAWRTRLEKIVSISPVADLKPLLRTSMNRVLKLDENEVEKESLTRHQRAEVDVTVWVGENERPAFLDQAQWMADHWACGHVVAEGRHHFDVIEPLADPESDLVAEILRP